jgi:NDP-sugar pyrophosphorylase family protein
VSVKFPQEAVFLAGGKGTRVAGVLPNTPKCLAPLGRGGRFLDLLGHRLAQAGIKKFFFLTHHLHEKIKEYVGDSFWGIPTTCVREDQPLGTGGSLIQALDHLEGEAFLALNADTYLHCDLQAFMNQKPPAKGVLIAATKVPSGSRFGKVQIEPDGRVAAFLEKEAGAGSPGFINAGLYLVDRAFGGGFVKGQACSLEKEIFPRLVRERRLTAWKTESAFLDIGTPEDLELAQATLIPPRIT